VRCSAVLSHQYSTYIFDNQKTSSVFYFKSTRQYALLPLLRIIALGGSFKIVIIANISPLARNAFKIVM